ncbi:MAG: CHAT domain-containing protein [Isosphaeraceae bacterium]
MRTILLLAANPAGTEPLRLDEEVKKIEQVVERSRRRDEFRIVAKWAVSADDLRRGLLDHGPEIVHFLGHGAGSGGGEGARDLASKGTAAPGGFTFEGEHGGLLTVSGGSLARLFGLFAEQVRCVVLNACHSASEGAAIAEKIDYVIGMNKAVGDRAAIKFAVGFYDGLVAGRSYEAAFEFGRSAIELEGIPEHLTPVLLRRRREGVRPEAAAGAPARSSRPPASSPERAPRPGQPPAIGRADLERVRSMLRRYIGPLADFIVDEKAMKSRDLADLCRRAAEEIDTQADREAFLRAFRDPR